MAGRALVVDPRPHAARVAEKAGFAVVSTDRGESALFEYGQRYFDVALVALGLRGMSGVDVCRELRRRSSTPILVTSDGSGASWLGALDAGADDHVRIPLEPAELRARVAAVARRRRGPLAVTRVVRLGRAEVRVGGGAATVAAHPLDGPASALLAVLCERPGVLAGRAVLADALAAAYGAGEAARLDAHVATLSAVLTAAGAPAVERTGSGAFRVPVRA